MELQKDLKICAKEAIPFACRDAINLAAFEARKDWQAEMGRKFTVRNRYVQRSIRVEPVAASAREVKNMVAVVGSLFGPLQTQETGGEMKGEGSKAYSIPERKNPKRPLSRREWQTKIKLWPGRPRYGSTRQRNAINIAHAVRHGEKFIELTTRHGPMIAAIAGRERVKLRIVWNLTRRSVHVPAHPTLGPAMDKVAQRMPDHMTQGITKQLKRRRVFGFR
jgi:hypothetical protein